jgi:YhcH/YjgK/YiaL family protein
MIVANLKDAEKYYGVHKDFKAAFEFLKSLSVDSPDGTTVFRDGEVWCGVTTSAAKVDDGGEKTFEAHRKFIDIQCVIKGQEVMGYSDISEVGETKLPYDESRDVGLYGGEYSTLILKDGDFAVFFPEDAHIPFISNPEGHKKAVFKIKV